MCKYALHYTYMPYISLILKIKCMSPYLRSSNCFHFIQGVHVSAHTELVFSFSFNICFHFYCLFFLIVNVFRFCRSFFSVLSTSFFFIFFCLILIFNFPIDVSTFLRRFFFIIENRNGLNECVRSLEIIIDVLKDWSCGHCVSAIE